MKHPDLDVNGVYGRMTILAPLSGGGSSRFRVPSIDIFAGLRLAQALRRRTHIDANLSGPYGMADSHPVWCAIRKSSVSYGKVGMVKMLIEDARIHVCADVLHFAIEQAVPTLSSSEDT